MGDWIVLCQTLSICVTRHVWGQFHQNYMLWFKYLMLAFKRQTPVFSISNFVKQLLTFETPKRGVYTNKIGILHAKASGDYYSKKLLFYLPKSQSLSLSVGLKKTDPYY